MSLSTCGACGYRYDLDRQSQVCPHPKRRTWTQSARLLAFLQANPGCTTMQIQLGMRPFLANPRARISDLRAAGISVECRKVDGVSRYFVREARPAPLRGEQEVMGLGA